MRPFFKLLNSNKSLIEAKYFTQNNLLLLKDKQYRKNDFQEVKYL